MISSLPDERAGHVSMEVLHARIGELEALVYVPGSWRCAKCSFGLVQGTLNASDGSISARDMPGEICPNDGSPLWRVTWRERAEELFKRCQELLREAG